MRNRTRRWFLKFGAALGPALATLRHRRFWVRSRLPHEFSAAG